MKGRQKGAAYEIKCLADTILSKEARGEDASWERGLLCSWAKYEGYEDAINALNHLPSHILRAGVNTRARVIRRA